MATPSKVYFDKSGGLLIRPYRMKDLAAIYGVCARTVRKWMTQHGIAEGKKTCKYFSIEEVFAIVSTLGFPQILYPSDQHR
jgi:hypothetical protein